MQQFVNQILCLKAEGKYNEAIKLAKDCYNKTNDTCFLNHLYECYLLVKMPLKAIKTLKKMLNFNKDNAALRKELAYNYFCLSDFKRALKHYKVILKNYPLSATNNFNVGCMYHHLNKHKKAFFYYNLALKINPRFLSAIDNLALAYYEIGDWKNAYKLFKSAIRISSSHPEAYHHLGIINRDVLKDYEISECYLKKAIWLDPKYCDNYYQLALTYSKSGKIKEAFNMIAKCIELKPKHDKSLKLLKELSKIA